MRGLTQKEKNTIQYGFLILLISITVYLVSTTLDIRLIPKIMKMVNVNYIFLGILLVMVYILIEARIIKIIVESIHKTKINKIGIKLATMGLYYNLVTPFASGSQPMQIYALIKSDVPVSKSFAIVTNKTVLYQSIVTIYSSLFVFMNLDLLKSEMPTIMILISIGIIMNITLVLGGLLIILSPQKVKFIIKIGLKFLIKFKIFKTLENKSEKINNYVDEFNLAIRIFIKNKRALVISICMTILQLTIFFSLVYCVYKAFNLNGASYLKLVTLQVFLYMSISPIPTPGNVGANELVYLSIFKDVFPKQLMGYSVFLYSGFVYYFMLVICGIITVITHYRLNKTDKFNFDFKKEKENI